MVFICIYHNRVDAIVNVVYIFLLKLIYLLSLFSAILLPAVYNLPEEWQIYSYIDTIMGWFLIYVFTPVFGFLFYPNKFIFEFMGIYFFCFYVLYKCTPYHSLSLGLVLFIFIALFI